jgi:hypothetical protein
VVIIDLRTIKQLIKIYACSPFFFNFRAFQCPDAVCGNANIRYLFRIKKEKDHIPGE